MGSVQIGNTKAGRYVVLRNVSGTIGPPNNCAPVQIGLQRMGHEQLGPGHMCQVQTSFG